jgi:hypothetical protein
MKNPNAPLAAGAVLLLEELRSLAATDLPDLDRDKRAKLLEEMVVQLAADLIAEVRQVALGHRPEPLASLRAVAERAVVITDRIEMTLQRNRTGLH